MLSASANDGKIAWHVNEDGRGAFGEQIVIDQTLARAREIQAVDVDDDGDLDVIASFSGSEHDDGDGVLVTLPTSIRWYENVDGQGHFGASQLIDDFPWYAGPPAFRMKDIDGDGRQDLFAFNYEKRVTWYQNLAGPNRFSAPRTIPTNPHFYWMVEVVDFDRDGDADFLSKEDAYFPVDTDGDGTADAWESRPEAITLYENGGEGTFEARQLFEDEPERTLHAIHSVDLDGDGDLDVLTGNVDRSSVNGCGFHCYPGQLRLSWRENVDGVIGEPRAFATLPRGGYRSRLDTVDVDGDGDLDFVASRSRHRRGNPGNDKVVWFENTDGEGTFGPEAIITGNTDGIRSLVAADIDSDGDLDFLSAAKYDGKIAWYENTADENPNTIIGDSNGDGIFDSADLVAVFKAGEYEDGIDNNSTFAEGDWNGDGNFDSGDLVAAFQAGTFVRAARYAEIASAIATIVDEMETMSDRERIDLI